MGRNETSTCKCAMCEWYTDKQRKHERYYQMFIALVASGGTFGYLLNEIAPLISSSIIAFVSVVKALFPHFIQPEKELCILDGLMDYYNGYMTELEHLYFRYETEDISDKETEEFLYHLKKKKGENSPHSTVLSAPYHKRGMKNNKRIRNLY